MMRVAASDVCLMSVCLSRTSGLSREQRGLVVFLGLSVLDLGTGVAHVGYHVNRTPLSRSKGQRLAGGGGILWRPPADLVNINSVRGRIVFGRIVFGAKRLGRNVLPWGEVSMRQNVRGAKSPDTILIGR